jgi:hypothetical protein
LPWGLLAGTGYQELWQLLQAQETQACGQWKFWGLLARCWLPGATGAAAVMGVQSLWAVGALVPACRHKFPGAVTVVSDMEEPTFRQWEFWGLFVGHGLQESSTVELQTRGNQAFGNRNPGASCWHKLPGVQYSSCCWHRGTKPAALHLLLPMEQWEPWVLFIQGCWFP